MPAYRHQRRGRRPACPPPGVRAGAGARPAARQSAPDCRHPARHRADGRRRPARLPTACVPDVPARRSSGRAPPAAAAWPAPAAEHRDAVRAGGRNRPACPTAGRARRHRERNRRGARPAWSVRPDQCAPGDRGRSTGPKATAVPDYFLFIIQSVDQHYRRERQTSDAKPARCRPYLRIFSTSVVRRMFSSSAACATTSLASVSACAM